MTGQGEPVQLFGGTTTANYFNMIGVQPIMGRHFLPQEEMAADVVMITEQFWRNRMNSDPAVLGEAVTLNGVPHTIIGVLPKLPLALVRAERGGVQRQAVPVPGHARESDHARDGFPAHDRPAQARRHIRAGAGGDGRGGARLQAGAPGCGR